MDAAFATLCEHGYDESMLYERKPLSVAQIEKLIGKEGIQTLLEGLVEKSPGKPTLVVDTDKREAITNKTTAVEDFKEEI